MPDLTRRSFLQSMSAAFSAVALGVKMPTVIEPPRINYDLFTSTFSRRYNIQEPFCKDGSIYATDSRLLIKHPGEWSGVGTAHIPAVEKLWWGEFDEPGWNELPPQKLELRGDGFDSYCGVCLGTGRVGSGIRKNPKYELDQTDSEPEFIGGKPCQQCHGTGDEFEFPHWERLGDGVFCPALMNRLRTLGGLDYKVADVDPSMIANPGRDRAHYVLFVRGDNGIKGMLMSMFED